MTAATATATTAAAATMVSDATFSDLERRLAVLEARVGVSRQQPPQSGGSSGDGAVRTIDERLGRLRIDLERKICGSNTVRTMNGGGGNAGFGGERSWKEIRKLLKDLDPGIALTHQQQPLLYKRQDVLAGATELSRDFRQLDAVLKLLLTGTTVDGTERIDPSASTAAANSAATTGAGSSKGGGGGASSSFATTPSKPLGLGGAGSTGSAMASAGTSAGTSGTSSPTKKASQAGAGGAGGTVQSQQQQARELHRKLRQQLQLQSGGTTGNSNANNAGRSTDADATLRLDTVTQAPIVVQEAAAETVLNPANHRRLEDLRASLEGLSGRVGTLRESLRVCLECYHTAAMAVSEKIVLADETITAAAAKRG